MPRKLTILFGLFMICFTNCGHTTTTTRTVSASTVSMYAGTKYAFNDSSYDRSLNRAERRPQRALNRPVTYEATVRLETMTGNICSGTAVAKRTILTAAHCLAEGETEMKINGIPHKMKHVVVDKSDHAFIVFDDSIPEFANVALLAAYPRIGDDIFYWGNPDGNNQFLRKGYVASRVQDAWVVDSNTWKGDSGAGVFNKDGRLIGVVSTIFGRSDINSNGMGYKFMAFFQYTFTAEQLAQVELKYSCESCVLTTL